MTSKALRIKLPAALTQASGGTTSSLDRGSAAFALSAAAVIVFNTVLTWVKDAYEPLKSLMASLTGHHWITHGLADVLLFVLLGFLFLKLGVGEGVSARGVTATLVCAVIAAGLGLAAWFLLY